jgi:CRISPR associated protein Cas1
MVADNGRILRVNFTKGFKPPEQWRSFQTRYIGRVQGKTGELARQFTARFAETPLQAIHNFGFLHDGRKPGRFSLSWDVVEIFRPVLATVVFEYAAKKVFERADFASQDGVVRLSSWIARECAAVACMTSINAGARS